MIQNQKIFTKKTRERNLYGQTHRKLEFTVSQTKELPEQRGLEQILLSWPSCMHAQYTLVVSDSL